MSGLHETARQVTEETAICSVCNAKIPFDRAVPYVPQPEDTPDHKMSIVSASVVLSGKDVVCDVKCLEAWEASEKEHKEDA